MVTRYDRGVRGYITRVVHNNLTVAEEPATGDKTKAIFRHKDIAKERANGSQPLQ